MPVICGVDFSPASQHAAEIAGRLARKWGTSLILAHAIDVQNEAVYGRLKDELSLIAKRALDADVERLRAHGVRTDGKVVIGKPDEVLVQLAREVGARAIVISALGTRSPTEWNLGASADRICQRSTTPVIVVRDPEPFMQWLDGQRPLRMIVAVDRTAVSRDVQRFGVELRQVAPVDVTVLHFFRAAEEYRRLGFGGVRSIVDADPKVQRILRRELESEVGTLPGSGRVELEVEVCLGRAQDCITSYADSTGADLIIVGSRRRNLLDRLWHGSTSRAVVQSARCAVACVTATPRAGERPIPEIRSVLVATDFSETGDAAVRWAYALVKPGGVVHLLTVIRPSSAHVPFEPTDLFDGPFPPEDAAALQDAERKLKEREPEAARARRITTQIKAAWSPHVADALVQAAERLAVDAVVLGTHGRTGVARAVLGSVAQGVATRCTRPVMLVNPAAA